MLMSQLLHLLSIWNKYRKKIKSDSISFYADNVDKIDDSVDFDSIRIEVDSLSSYLAFVL